MKYGYNLFSAWGVTKDRDSLFATMRALKKMGYDGVEFFLYFDIPADEMKAACQEMGLIPFSTHPRLFRFFDALDEEIAYAKAVGIKTLVMPHVVDEERNSDFYKRLLAAIPTWKQKCDEAGLALAWHNHDFEFKPYGENRYLLDAILSAAPGVQFEIDTFWSSFYGVDTLSLMEQYKDRIKYVHFKDYIKDGQDYSTIGFSALGEGKLELAPIAAKASCIGAEWAVIEQDNHTKDVLEDAENSIHYLKKLFEAGGNG